MSEELLTSANEADEAPTEQKPRDCEWFGTLFSLEAAGHAWIIAPQINGGAFRYATLQIETNALRRKLDEASFSALIVDLYALNYVGSEVIGALVVLARKAEDAGVSVVFCSASPELRDALANMGLHRLWTIFATRDEALKATAKNPRRAKH